MDKTAINPTKKPARKGFRADLIRYGIASAFIFAAAIYAGSFAQGGAILAISAMIGAYMAVNIGANDVANNVGPAVGAKALTMGGALIIAGIFEAAGALIAGGEVVGTIRSGIINPELIPDPDTFIWLMMSALLAGAMWLNIATAVGAPVSTTHSIVGAVLGAGVAASGFGIADWSKVGAIAASWVISPVLGGLIAAGFLYLIKRSITYQQDMSAAATRVVPVLVALMAWVFSVYLLLKGVSNIWKIGLSTATVVGFLIAIAVYWFVKPRVARRAQDLGNTKQDVNQFFTLPLIFAAALLSFAHGSNDVANAVGPLAAIVDTLANMGEIHSKASIPLWVMMVGALGIVFGLALFGPRVIRTVGSEITELDQTRAFCIAMAATLTVIVASQMGLPVSSTHIAVGGVFGVGFLREYIKNRYNGMIAEIRAHHRDEDSAAVNAFLERFDAATIQEKGLMLKELKIKAKEQMDPELISNVERKGLSKAYRKDLVKRSHMLRIAAAWVITVPASAIMAALIFFTIRGAMLP